VMIVAFGALWLRQLKQEVEAKDLEKAKLNMSTALDPCIVTSDKMKEPLSINVAMFEQPLLRLTLADVLRATNGFCKTNIIGDGGFGTVYKAHLPDGRVVAVKKLGHGLSQGNREFLAEMETLGKVKHRHLVPLLGYCSFGEEKLLVYDYMSNGSLDLWLRNRADALEVLDWPKRFRIALGSARGLCFLHHGFIPHIIHRDIKASNILLDADFEPRVADFGLARLISAYDSHVSTDIAGTFGYIPPEYGQSWRSTTRGDVYSYGVILLELLTGKEPTRDDFKDADGGNLVGWVRQLICQGDAPEALDPELASQGPGPTWKLMMLKVLHIANLCTAEDPIRRPTMLQVVKFLKDIEDLNSTT
jgi:serine/threonine protein kinase